MMVAAVLLRDGLVNILKSLKPCRNLLRREPQTQTDTGRCKGIVDIVFANCTDDRVKAAVRMHNRQIDMISLLHDMLCAHIACRIFDAEIQGLCRDAVFLAPQQRLISVEHSRAAFLQSLQNFHLGIADALTGTKEFNVCGADIGNDGNPSALPAPSCGRFL